eukprot:2107983-Amphidinium_carterae.1
MEATGKCRVDLASNCPPCCNHCEDKFQHGLCQPFEQVWPVAQTINETIAEDLTLFQRSS